MENYHSPKEFLDAAKSEETTSEELELLSKKDYSFVKAAVAKNKNTSLNTLKSLIPTRIETFCEQELALAFSENPNISKDIVEELILKIKNVVDNGREHNLGFDAGLKLCNNSGASIRIIEELLQNQGTSTEFRKVLARETARVDILNILKDDRSEKVRKKALERLGNSESKC